MDGDPAGRRSAAPASTTYTLGGAGRHLGPHLDDGASCASGTFVVRLINVSNQSNKDFRLDGVSVQVHYTP